MTKRQSIGTFLLAKLIASAAIFALFACSDKDGSGESGPDLSWLPAEEAAQTTANEGDACTPQHVDSGACGSEDGFCNTTHTVALECKQLGTDEWRYVLSQTCAKGELCFTLQGTAIGSTISDGDCYGQWGFTYGSCQKACKPTTPACSLSVAALASSTGKTPGGVTCEQDYARAKAACTGDNFFIEDDEPWPASTGDCSREDLGVLWPDDVNHPDVCNRCLTFRTYTYDCAKGYWQRH